MPYEAGFDILEGDKVAATIRIGDNLPWSGPGVPVGQWETKAIGQCLRCSAWLKTAAVFNGLKFIGIKDVQLDL